MSKRRNRLNRKQVNARNVRTLQRPQRAGSESMPHLPAKLVDIVMPVYGGAEFIMDCLQTLFFHDAGAPYNLILVDDQSPADPKLDAAFAYVQTQGHYVFRQPRNSGFAATCNVGAALGRSPWILLLNTDVRILHDGWLKAMVDEGDDPEVGVVGALLTYYQKSYDWAPAHSIRPSGKVQHAGVVFDIMRRPYHIFAGWNPDHAKVTQRREMNCVTGACFLTQRELWQKIGGLDTSYTKGNFEDVQYCLMARLHGYKVVFTPEAHLEHYAGGSGNSTTADRNAQIFQIKMGEFVVYDEFLHW